MIIVTKKVKPQMLYVRAIVVLILLTVFSQTSAINAQIDSESFLYVDNIIETDSGTDYVSELPNTIEGDTPLYDGFSWYFTFATLTDKSDSVFSLPQQHLEFVAEDGSSSCSPRDSQQARSNYRHAEDRNNEERCTFEGEYVGFQVIEVIQLWSNDNVVKTQTYPLDCIVGGDGDVEYRVLDDSWELKLVGNTSISCRSVDLQTEVMALSQGEIDPCGATYIIDQGCDLIVTDVFVDTYAYAPGMATQKMPIFTYDDLQFSLGDSEMSLTIGDYQTTTTTHFPVYANVFEAPHYRIAQDNDLFEHYVGEDLIHTDSTHGEQFTFSSAEIPLTFGYDPADDSYFTDGIIVNGIFDPYSGCNCFD